ncbi:sugar transferase [Saccharopolyspora sp. WRP15-2]|uniref:Sugar transferase n=1 Tax=Saccharopolyspora oryzae TaxID=2997343 RepID=A0ABT4USU5_9PSEU|nr:sugar transferase [Saccharopolyspora oryzae]MDA3624189.1 sugar transferase [Saccharopolyspora oryzae]
MTELSCPSPELTGDRLPVLTAPDGPAANASPSTWDDRFRRALDVSLASAALAVLSAPMLLIALCIRSTSRGPALFRQQRVGLNGRPFTFYKFRTMRLDSSDAAHRELIVRELHGEDTKVNGSCKLAADPRITRFGGWLRRTSLDELPQLINVLRGEMTLVGPRPCQEWEAAMFPAEFQDRFTVLPGLTGLWQVRGRSALGTLDMLKLDAEYVRSRTVRLDLRILASTLPSMLRGDGAR